MSECPKLAQKEYEKRHDWVGKKIHWEVCKEEGFIVNETLPEIGDILRPRSIWHAVSNYQDGGIKKAVHRKNKD